MARSCYAQCRVHLVDIALMEVEESETRKGLCARNIIFTLYVQAVGPTTDHCGQCRVLYLAADACAEEKASCTCVAPYLKRA